MMIFTNFESNRYIQDETQTRYTCEKDTKKL